MMYYAIILIVGIVIGYFALRPVDYIRRRYSKAHDSLMDYYSQIWGLDVNEVKEIQKGVDSELLLKINKRIYELHNLKEGLLNKQQ